MDDRGASQRGLGRAVARRLGWADDSGRRWLIKLLSGDVERPEPAQLRALEAELGVRAGYLTVPSQPQRDARLSAIERHLAALEDGVAQLLEGQEKLVEALADARRSRPQDAPEKKSRT